MDNWIIDVINTYGYLGILLLIAIENIFPPIPSEVILTLGGFLTTSTSMTVFGVALVATIGSVVGAVILYGIGLLVSVERLEKIIEKWGHLLRLTKDDIRQAEYWFNRYGIWTVFFCRLVPLLRSLISIPAGMSHMRFLLFLILTSVGSLTWNMVLVNLGAAVGSSWRHIVYYFDIYSNIVYLLLAIVLIAAVVLYVKRKFKSKN